MDKREEFSRLSCRTRGDSDPHGKERVYFTCHPDDFETCFDLVCEDIFKTQNCAIYYNPSRGERWRNKEDMEFELLGMQLFVIPITHNFLYDNNDDTRTVEFNFAKDNKIPILPIMWERGLDEGFNSICDHLQCIDREADSDDNDAIPYEKKLKDFLSSVLLGDEMSKKVRAAFEAYIFLSYRKKDRKFAKKLMRLIHQNKFCEDVAIWYDEFLVPGRDFDEAIMAAMKKSDLFALVVTPNLLEPENYVLKTEYPMAIEEKMPMLPTEMEPTDHALLREKFDEIELLDANDSPAISSKLEDWIHKVHENAIRENSNDPKHNFFIGLAYLNGIDVEEDSERAVRLITGAADADIPEAMEKLAQMYKYGEGVGHDDKESALWLERLADYWKKQFEGSKFQKEEGKFQEYGKRFIDALADAGDAWYDMSELKPARPLYEKMLSVSEELLEADKSIENCRNLSHSYVRLGALFEKGKNFIEAIKYYLNYVDLSKKLDDMERTPESKRDLVLSYARLGSLYRKAGNLTEAKSWLSMARKIMEDLSKNPDVKDSTQILSTIYLRLGNVCRDEGNSKDAKEYYIKSRDLKKDWDMEVQTPESRRALSLSYNRLAVICRREGNLVKAKEYLREEIEINEELSKKTKSVQSRQDLASSYKNLGLIFDEEEEVQKAKYYYIESYKIWKELAKEIKTEKAKQKLSESCYLLGHLCISLPEKKEWYLKELKVDRKLAEETNTAESREDLCLTYMRVGDIFKLEGNIEEAERRYKKGIELNERCAEEINTAESYDRLSSRCFSTGVFFDDEGKKDEAFEYFEKGKKYEEMAEEMENAAKPLKEQFDNCISQGDACMENSKLAKAEEYYIEAIKLGEKLTKALDSIKFLQSLAGVYGKLGDFYEMQGRKDEAIECYMKRKDCEPHFANDPILFRHNPEQ